MMAVRYYWSLLKLLLVFTAEIPTQFPQKSYPIDAELPDHS